MIIISLFRYILSLVMNLYGPSVIWRSLVSIDSISIPVVSYMATINNGSVWYCCDGT